MPPGRWHKLPTTYTTPDGAVYPLFVDMLKQPHLLVAGATGSGKSVVINGIMATALYHPPGAIPGGVEFILIDPKRVELVEYKKLPHTVIYASEPGEFLSALKNAMRITENRYKSMQRDGQKKFNGGDLYIVIDEFADLMTTQRRTVQPMIQRIAQIGRAAKVHIILATQTPIAKVLPTEIKCNFDSRVGLRTRSPQDSRNILNETGLEKLPRYGQAVYVTPERKEQLKVPYIQPDEINSLCRWWTAQTPKQSKPRRRWFFNRR